MLHVRPFCIEETHNNKKNVYVLDKELLSCKVAKFCEGLRKMFAGSMDQTRGYLKEDPGRILHHIAT